MSIETGIIAVLEAHNGRADRLVIMSTLREYSQGSIEVALSRMVKLGAVIRISKGVYELPTPDKAATPALPPRSADKPTAPWLADGLTAYGRVRLFVEANPKARKHAVLNMLARFVDGAARAFGAMVVEGAVHVRDDGSVALGRNPRAPVAPKHRDPNRGPKPLPTHTPSEERAREASAEAASEVQEAIATPTLAADEPDVSALGKNPAAEIGPPLAPNQIDRIEPRDSHRAFQMPSAWPGLADNDLDNRTKPQESPMSETTQPEVGEKAQAPLTTTTPVATFHVELPGLHIAISGEAKAVMQAVAAIKDVLE